MVAVWQVHSEAASVNIASGAGPLEDSLPAFVAQTFQERYKVSVRIITTASYILRWSHNKQCCTYPKVQNNGATG